MKIWKYLEKCVFKKLLWKLLRNSLFRWEGQTKDRQFIISKPFKDENPKRTRNKILKRALSAKTHFFLKSSIRQILFEKQDNIENV
jgi:hypothetical protein